METQIRIYSVSHGDMKIRDIILKWRWNPSHLRKYHPVMIVASMSDIPAGPLSKNIYLVQRENRNRWVVFDCPRGHEKRIEINLMQNASPSWKIYIKKRKISLYPSIAVESPECDCHFWLKNNIAYTAMWR